MPSARHEAATYSLQDQPEVAVELLRATGIELPEHDEILVDSANLPTLVPTEYRADGVFTLRRSRAPVAAVAMEIQLRWVDEKRYVWPAYLGNLWERRRCPVRLLVVCFDPATAKRCARPIVLGHPGFVLVPHVIGPSQIPHVTDADRARLSPALTVLSALAHPEDKEVLAVVPEALSPLTSGLSSDYTQLLGAALPAASRRFMEDLMAARRWGFDILNKAQEEGHEQGLAEGLAEGLARGVLTLLEDRKVRLDDAARGRITSCRDESQLLAWLRRAPRVTTAEELFA